MYYPLEYFLVVDKDTLLTSTHDKQDTMFVEVFCDKGTPIKLSHVGQENILTFYTLLPKERFDKWFSTSFAYIITLL